MSRIQSAYSKPHRPGAFCFDKRVQIIFNRGDHIIFGAVNNHSNKTFVIDYTNNNNPIYQPLRSGRI